MAVAAARARPRAREATQVARAPVQFVSSGNYLLDCVLGGGWAQGRIANIVGDKSAGKTLLAVEACANFLPLVASENDIRYLEAELAYDEEYGREIGMPANVHPVDTISTIEGFFDDLKQFIEARQGRKTPSLYVVDSLDAMTDETEQKRDIRTGSYGTEKAALMSELFRRNVAACANANCTVLVLSQIRDKIGVRFGETKTRSGGRALDFYASQVIWLSEIKKLERTVTGVKRFIGTNVRARNKKNKVGKPYRQADLTLVFNYGVDDEVSMINWLEEVKAMAPAEVNNIRGQITQARGAKDREWLYQINTLLRDLVAERWDAIDAAIQPPMSKY